MIVSTINSGFGNQLFQYAAGYAAARRARTSLYLDTRFFNHDKFRPYQLDRLNISGRPLGLLGQLRVNLARDASRVPAIEPLKRIAGLKQLKIFRDAAAGFQPAVRDLGRHAVLIGYWQNEDYFADYADDVRRELSFKADPDDYNRAILARIAASPSVSLHVRRGDYLKPGEILSPCPTGYYQAAVKWMSDRVSDAKFFVFSDDPDWARANLPLPENSEFVTGNLGKDDTQDLRLMSHCRHFIIANSTFSWWGAWLGAAAGKQVVAPAKWFRIEHGNEQQIVPKRWVRL